MSGSTHRWESTEQPCSLSHPSCRGRAGGKLPFWVLLAEQWFWPHPCFCSRAAVTCYKAKATRPFPCCYCSPQVKGVTKSPGGLLDVTVSSAVPGHKPTEGVIRDVDCLLWAVGRQPNSDRLCLDQVVRRQRVPSVLGGDAHGSLAVPRGFGVPLGLQSLSQDGVPTTCPPPGNAVATSSGAPWAVPSLLELTWLLFPMAGRAGGPHGPCSCG